MVGDMGYAEKLQKLCTLRGYDQSTLAEKIGMSKSTMSRILSGVQEPKIKLAYELAKVLGVTLDYLVDDEMQFDPTGHLVHVTDDEMSILRIVRRLGYDEALGRLVNVPTSPPGASSPPPAAGFGGSSAVVGTGVSGHPSGAERGDDRFRDDPNRPR